MKRLITYMLVMITLLCAGSLSAGAENLTARQKNEVIAKINKATSGLKSMSCNFVQTKYMSLLSDKMVSEGSMYFKQPDRLRWEYTKPYKYLFILNGAKVYVGNKSRKDVIDTRTNKVFKEVARIMMNTVTGKALANTGDFVIDVSGDASSWHVTLVPRKRELKQMFSKVELIFGKSSLMISELNIYEKNKDRTNIKMKNIRTNISVNETLFAIP